MYSWSEDEDSESSSTSETSDEKKTYFERPEPLAVEDTAIKLDDVTLEKLTDKIRNISNVSCGKVDEFDGNQQIKRFLVEPEVKCLFIYSNNGSAESSLAIPKKKIGFTYFVKSNSTINIDEVNFLRNIFFGQVGVNFEYALLAKIKCAFIFTLYCMKQIPYHIRAQSAEKLELLSCYLTVSFYKQFGLSEIQPPALTLISQKSPTMYARINDILNLYEDFVVLWCKQISNAILDEEMDYQYLKDFSPIILNEFWRYKWFNLKQMMDHVKDRNSINMYNFLEEHNSVHTKWIYELHKQLEHKMSEVKLNVSFLQAMKRISAQVEVSSIKSLPCQFPDMFLYMNIITELSKYFNLTKNKILLITSLTQQIMNVCKRKIKPENIFKSETEESMDRLIDSVQICCLYKEILKQDEMFVSIPTTHFASILNIIDMFVHRCLDLLNICSSINIFSNLAKHQNNQLMKIENYVKMKEHTQGITDEFSYNLEQLKTAQHAVFEFQNNDWFSCNDRFQNQINEINCEVMQKVDKISEYISTIEDAIDVLRVTYQYSKSCHLRDFFSPKHDMPSNLLKTEITTIQKNLLRVKVNLTNGFFQQRPCVAFCFRKKRRLQFLLKFIKKCHWLMQRDGTNECRREYEETIAEIDKFIVNEYKKWLEMYQISVLNRLKRPLIKNCFYRNGLVEVNIDRRLLKIIEETYNWIQIGFIPSPNIEKLLNVTPNIMILFQNVENLVFTYNRIFTNLASDEQILHSQVMKQCYNVIRPIVSTFHWDSDHSNRIVVDCTRQIQKIENVINNYKYRSNQIIELSKSICVLQIMKLSKITLEEIKEELETVSIVFFKKLVTYFKEISNHLRATFDNFKNTIGEMKPIWNSYVNKIDLLLEYSLKCCTENNLNYFMAEIVPDSECGRVVMKVQLRVEIIENELVYHPNISEITKFFSDFGLRMLNMIKLIPRIFNEFKLEKNSKKRTYAKQLMQNGEITKLRERINTAISDNLDELNRRMQFWDPYKLLWKEDSKNYIQNRCTSLSSIEDYEGLFSSYSCMVKEMELKNDFEKISLFELNVTKLRLEVIKQCENRLRCLSEFVKQNIKDLMENIDQQMDTRLNELSSFNFRSDDYVSFMKDTFIHAAHIEKQIQRIHDFISLLRTFQVVVENDIKERQEISERKWKKYKNSIERCRLKVNAIHKVIL